MPTHRWAFFLTVAIGLPTILTFFSLLHTHPRGNYASEDQPKSGIGAFFSFHTPSSLFPPSAIISLTDENSTFFLARPADFGPALISDGLSGALWIGSGFGEDDTGHSGAGASAEGELGCSDVPGWNEKLNVATSDEKENTDSETTQPGTGISAADAKAPKLPRSEPSEVKPTEDDGTDDHLHHPLPSSPVSKPVEPGDSTRREADNIGHADIQSLQEGAEISGKVALLSRGGCGFLEKVKWAQRRGATALIVGDNTRGGALVTMYARGDTSNVTIPSVFTSHTTAHLLSSLMPPGDDGGDASSPVKQNSNGGKKNDIEAKATSAKARKHPSAKMQHAKSQANLGWKSALGSKFGLGKQSKGSAMHSDTRRPPSSGRLDVAAEKHKEVVDKDERAVAGTHTVVRATITKKDSRKTSSHQNDDFVIGVQDWRDPDLVVKASSSVSTTTAVTGSSLPSEALLNKGKEVTSDQKVNAALTGGSITPGSGEYSKPGKSDDNDKGAKSDDKKSGNTSLDQLKPGSSNRKEKSEPIEEHEGLWVTITPTAMSTSPFFDTLLVLVVSPLVTLTVVYALLLLRSRIRRRRWRAPKSVVERLPIRTYHTMSSSSTSSSTRFATPETSSPTTPLLQGTPRSFNSRTRQRSATTTGVSETAAPSLDKASAKAAVAQNEMPTPAKKRKGYHGKHIECVVCLEEYIDGKSRVMSLPCGHEFHAECM